ncbi:uncharacterized protein LOC134540317 [Bacillus rossius redtenbacheri]|uniref:uncharacterized protein LOC134540317 n=1 Tax=Bacillus rossius redtenbacheri TaxID=93214 RepID=UPI002FDE8B72
MCKRVRLEQVTPRAFSAAYSWMLRPDQRPPADLQHLLELLAAARQLGVAALAASCVAGLRSDPSLVEHRAVLALVGARRLAGCRLDDALLPKVRDFFLPLVSSRYFLLLSAGEVAALLGSDNIRVHGELEVFFAAARWLLHGWPRRREHAARLAGRVRFGRVPPRALASLRGVAARDPRVRRLVADGLAGLALRTRPPPPPRDYTDEASCPRTYEGFLADLEGYRRMLPEDWPEHMEPPPPPPPTRCGAGGGAGPLDAGDAPVARATDRDERDDDTSVVEHVPCAAALRRLPSVESCYSYSSAGLRTADDEESYFSCEEC